MKATVVGHATDVPVLQALRDTLADADEAILCSAFVRRAGVHLIEPQLTTLGDQARLVATSTFGGSSTGEAFGALAELRTRLRVANPARGTFHPKLYVARTSDTVRALVGSANLTGGLVSNVEAAILLEGSPDEPALDDAWGVAEAYWSHEASELWAPLAAKRPQEVFDPELLAAIRREVERDPIFLTVATGKPNRVRDVTPTGIWVETEASAVKRRPAQEIPAWMFQLAADHLEANGSLTNAYLVSSDGLNVKRSSAVCAILSHLPWVKVVSRNPVALKLQSKPWPPAGSLLSSENRRFSEARRDPPQA